MAGEGSKLSSPFHPKAGRPFVRFPHRPVIPWKLEWSFFAYQPLFVFLSHPIILEGMRQQCNQWHLLAHPGFAVGGRQAGLGKCPRAESPARAQFLGTILAQGKRGPKARRETSHHQHH